MSAQFTMDADWLAFHPAPGVPHFKPPPGAVDAHCHVFGPGDEFAYAPQRKYTPCDASKHQLWVLRERLGFSRCVIVQATCHGTDNAALVDALAHSNNTARGVATVKPNVTDEELQRLHDAGVRGVRFNFVKRLVDALPHTDLQSIAERVARLGWHVVIYFEAQDLAEHQGFFTQIPATVVFDHMGRPDVTQPVKGAEFDRFVRLLSDHLHMWSKVTCPERLSESGPPFYDDFVPFARRLVEIFPERVLWGSDWPHPNLKSHMPDDAHLVDMIPRIATRCDHQRRLLVDNPRTLYWQEEIT